MNLFSANVAYASLDTFLANVNREIINPIILFLFALALLYFLFGMFQFLVNGGNDEKRTTGKSHMMWGIVGLTIMMGVWFILEVTLSTLNLDGKINPKENEVELPPYTPSYTPKFSPR